MLPVDLIEGERRRDAALVKLRGKNPNLFDRLTAAALAVAIRTGAVVADDLRAAVPIPAGASPKVVGSVFGNLATAGLLTAAGDVKTARPKAHARPVTRWRLADATAAAAKLAELRRTLSAD